MADSFNDFIAGWLGGAAGIIVGSPLDVLKARLQAPKNHPVRIGPWQTLKDMVQVEGMHSIFKGVLSPVVGLAGLNALLFVSYGSLLRYLHPPAQETQPTLWQIYLAGAGAGFACFFFSTPTELVKIQAQMTKLPKSTLQVTREIYAMHGWKGFYQGGLITMIRDAPSYGLYFLAYEGMKRTLDVSGDDHAWKLLLAGGVAGTVSWASIYPIDVIKSRLQMQLSQESLLVRPPYRSIKDCVVRSYRSEGSGVFFRGLWPTLLRGFPVNAVTFYVYELVMNLLE